MNTTNNETTDPTPVGTYTSRDIATMLRCGDENIMTLSWEERRPHFDRLKAMVRWAYILRSNGVTRFEVTSGWSLRAV